VRRWDPATGAPVGEPVRFDGELMACSADGAIFLTKHPGDMMRLWDRARGEALDAGFPAPEILTAAFSPDGKVVATGSADGRAQLWDAATGQAKSPRLGHRDQGQIVVLAFSPDGKTLLTGSLVQTALLWREQRGQWVAKGLVHQ